MPCTGPPPAPLLALHRSIGQVLQQQGIALDKRPWQPHITLARQARGTDLPSLAPVDWPLRDLVPARSRGGYQVLQRWG